MTNNPFFGILLSIITYEFGAYIAKKTKTPIANPLLISIILSIAILKIFKIPYEDFQLGGEYIKFLLGPATVCLVIPLYRKWDILKQNVVPVLVGIFAGAVTSLVTILVMTKAVGLDVELIHSILPKSITTAIGVDVAAEFGGLPAIAAFAIVLTGVYGAVAGPSILKAVKVKDPVAVGIAMGTASHAVGTSKAMELGEEEGAMSGLCIGICGIMTVLLMPLFVSLV